MAICKDMSDNSTNQRKATCPFVFGSRKNDQSFIFPCFPYY